MNTIPQIPLKSVVIDSTRLLSTPWSYYITHLGNVVSTLAEGAVLSFNKREGDIVLTSADVSGALGYTPIQASSPILTGLPQAPTQPVGTSDNSIATTEFVHNAAKESSLNVAAYVSLKI